MIKLLTQHLSLSMFMGLPAHMLGVRHVLFASLRDGDVTVWYQSSRLQQWASMGQEGCSDRRWNYLLCSTEPQQTSKMFYVVEQSKELAENTSTVVEGLVKWTSVVAEELGGSMPAEENWKEVRRSVE